MTGILIALAISVVGGVIANVWTKNIIKNKKGFAMTSVVITYLVCCTIVVCFYFYCCHAAIENHSTGTASSGISSPAESGKFPVGPGDSPAPGNEESATSHQGT